MHWLERFKIGAALCAAFGVLVGMGEHIWLAAAETQPLSLGEAFALGWVLVATMCAVSLVPSLPLLPLYLRAERTSRDGVGLVFVHAMLGLASLFLWQSFHALAAALGSSDYRFVLGVLLLCSLLGGLLSRNVLVWVRRLSTGAWSMRTIALFGCGCAVLLNAMSSGVWAYRGLGGGFALEDDRTILLISVEGLDAAAQPPDGLGEGWTAFTQAVNPSPYSDSAHASMFTGLHPLRHGVGVSTAAQSVLERRDGVIQQVPILAETLRAEGYRTAGFVSSGDLLRSTGLERGFDTYDDDVLGRLPGMHLTSLHRWTQLAAEWMGTEQAVHHRGPDVVAEEAARWMTRATGSPWFLWVHLADSGEDSRSALEVASDLTDAALEQSENDLLVVWMGAPGVGQQLGSPLRESALRVPLFTHASWLSDVRERVDAQVRPMDVHATILEAVGVRAPGPSEGVSLLPYVRGEDNASLWCSLVARDADGEWWFGLRNDRVKYIENPAGEHSLYDLQVDPEAREDVSAQQESVVIRAQDILAPERKALVSWQEQK